MCDPKSHCKCINKCFGYEINWIRSYLPNSGIRAPPAITPGCISVLAFCLPDIRSAKYVSGCLLRQSASRMHCMRYSLGDLPNPNLLYTTAYCSVFHSPGESVSSILILAILPACILQTILRSEYLRSLCHFNLVITLLSRISVWFCHKCKP